MAEKRLIDQMYITDLHQRLYCGWRSTPLVDVTSAFYAIKDERDYSNRYMLSIKAEIIFECRTIYMDEAVKNAKEGMARHLYSHMLLLTDRLRAAVYAANEKEMLDIIDEMEKEMCLK